MPKVEVRSIEIRNGDWLYCSADGATKLVRSAVVTENSVYVQTDDLYWPLRIEKLEAVLPGSLIEGDVARAVHLRLLADEKEN